MRLLLLVTSLLLLAAPAQAGRHRSSHRPRPAKMTKKAMLRAQAKAQRQAAPAPMARVEAPRPETIQRPAAKPAADLTSRSRDLSAWSARHRVGYHSVTVHYRPVQSLYTRIGVQPESIREGLAARAMHAVSSTRQIITRRAPVVTVRFSALTRPTDGEGAPASGPLFAFNLPR